MENPICEELLVYQLTRMEDENLYLWYIVNCVFNAFLIISAIIFNSVTIQALRKTSSLPQPLKTLLLNLAVSDLGVGLLVEPFYFGLLVKWLQRDNSTDATCTSFLVISCLFTAASFLGVMVLSTDRFLAVHLHLRYQELMTHKWAVAVVISIWVFSAFVSLVFVYANISNVVISVIGVVCLLITAALYFKIYKAVRRHRNQIQALQVQQVAQNGQTANAARLRKSAVGVFYVYLVFWLCYVPQFCNFAVFVISSITTGVKVFAITSTTLLFLNSTLNPVIYCWKMRRIRRAVLDILQHAYPSLRKASVNNSRS